jgi:hypothetical protein
MRTLIGVCLTGLTFAMISWAQTAPPKTTPAKASPVPMAAWREAPWYSILGVEKHEFHTLGLDKLAAADAENLLSYLVLNRPSLSCVKWYPASKKDELKFIHLYVEAGNTNSTELAGNLRSKFSALKDISLVYSDQDADYIVSVLGLASHVNGREVGYFVSTTVNEPCTYNAPKGYDQGDTIIRKAVASYVDSGPTQNDIANSIADTVYGRDFDEIRRKHAKQLKSYE